MRMWREKGMFLYVYHKGVGVDKLRNNLTGNFTKRILFYKDECQRTVALYYNADNPLTSL